MSKNGEGGDAGAAALHAAIRELKAALALEKQENAAIAAECETLRRQYRDMEEYAGTLEQRLHMIGKQDISAMGKYYAFVNQNYSTVLKILVSQSSQTNYQFTRQSVVMVHQLLLSLRKIIDFQQNKFGAEAAKAFGNAELQVLLAGEKEGARRYQDEIQMLKQQIQRLNEHLLAIAAQEGPQLLTKHSLVVRGEEEALEVQNETLKARFRENLAYVETLKAARASADAQLQNAFLALEERKAQLDEKCAALGQLEGENQRLAGEIARLQADLAASALDQRQTAQFASTVGQTQLEVEAVALKAETEGQDSDSELAVKELVGQPAAKDLLSQPSPGAQMSQLGAGKQRQEPPQPAIPRPPLLIPRARCKTRSFQAVSSLPDAVLEARAENKRLRADITAYEVQNEALRAEIGELNSVVAAITMQKSESYDFQSQTVFDPLETPKTAAEQLARENADLRHNIALFVQENTQLRQQLKALQDAFQAAGGLRQPAAIKRLEGARSQ